MNIRIKGFDMARAYAIFGMFIVNFNFCFGSFGDQSATGQFLNLFIGNSTAIFIICAGMGVSLMTSSALDSNRIEKKKFKTLIFKRSWFLFALGLVLYPWWPGDILHFYGAYLHVAAFLLFIPKKIFLWIALLVIFIFHLLLFIIPIETSWNFTTYEYSDFWTPIGFLRNSLYNGWNAVFPWMSYFLIGMYLGRIDWQNSRIKKQIFILALCVFISFEGIRKVAMYCEFEKPILDYIMYDYFPPYLPFVLISASFGVMVIVFCCWIGERFAEKWLIKSISNMGKMTLTNYVQHLTVGMLILQMISGLKYTGFLQQEKVVSPQIILLYSCGYFFLSFLLCNLWLKYFKTGPLEMLMRKISEN